jgi:hypothetical protein
MSTQKVADRCAELGFPGLTRSVITSIEMGTRESISVPEWLVLAQALEVPALLLLFPLGRVDEMEVLPGAELAPWEGLQWSEAGGQITASPREIAKRGVVWLFRQHDRAVSYWRTSYRDLLEVDKVLDGEDPDPRSELVQRAAFRLGDGGELVLTRDDVLAEANRRRPNLALVVESNARTVKAYRQQIRRLGLKPPASAIGLEHLDDDDTPAYPGAFEISELRAEDSL